MSLQPLELRLQSAFLITNRYWKSITYQRWQISKQKIPQEKKNTWKVVLSVVCSLHIPPQKNLQKRTQWNPSTSISTPTKPQSPSWSAYPPTIPLWSRNSTYIHSTMAIAPRSWPRPEKETTTSICIASTPVVSSLAQTYPRYLWAQAPLPHHRTAKTQTPRPTESHHHYRPTATTPVEYPSKPNSLLVTLSKQPLHGLTYPDPTASRKLH